MIDKIKTALTKKRTIAAALTICLLWTGWEYPKILTLLTVLGLPGMMA